MHAPQCKPACPLAPIVVCAARPQLRGLYKPSWEDGAFRSHVAALHTYPTLAGVVYHYCENAAPVVAAMRGRAARAEGAEGGGGSDLEGEGGAAAEGGGAAGGGGGLARRVSISGLAKLAEAAEFANGGGAGGKEADEEEGEEAGARPAESSDFVEGDEEGMEGARPCRDGAVLLTPLQSAGTGLAPSQ